MDLTTIFKLLGGLALFLFGIKVMGDALEKAAGPRLQHLLSRMTRNKIMGVCVGALVTGVIQSSSATTVMVVGFVNAGLLNLGQAVGVIMGANIGTTVTSLILSIKLDMGAIFAVLGMATTLLFKKESIKQAGMIMMGLGVLFTGMDMMSSSMAPLKEMPFMRDLFIGVSNPLLGLLLGACVTAVLQSSSASVGLLQVLAEQGLVPMNTAFYILLGQNIGTCVTALLASVGTGATARRAALVHLMFNVLGAILFMAASFLLPISEWVSALAPGNIKLEIAFVHILFNVSTTVVLLPLSGVLEKLTCLMIHEKPVPQSDLRMEFFDERLLATPPVAAEQLYRETCRMGELAKQNVLDAISAAMTGDLAAEEEIERREHIVDYLEEAIANGLVAVRSLDLPMKDNKRVGTLFHVTNDLERVSDHAMNFLGIAKERVEKHVKLSDKAEEELRGMISRVQSILDTALSAFSRGALTMAERDFISVEEDKVDRLAITLRDAHIERLKAKKCSPKSGVAYLEMLSNLERVADHAVNIAAAATEKPQYSDPSEGAESTI